MSQESPVYEVKALKKEKAHFWAADDVVDAAIERMKQISLETGRGHLGSGNAVRRILGLPEKPGMINGEVIDQMDVVQLKAILFDLFFQIYGADLVSGLRLRKKQKVGGRKGVDVRQAKAAKQHSEILRIATELIRAGKPKRSIASMVALKTGATAKHVREVLKKAEMT